MNHISGTRLPATLSWTSTLPAAESVSCCGLGRRAVFTSSLRLELDRDSAHDYDPCCQCGSSLSLELETQAGNLKFENGPGS